MPPWNGYRDDPARTLEPAPFQDARPNPAPLEARLTLQVPAAGPVRVVLYDALGRTVAVVFDGAATAGQTLDLRVGTAALPAGAYLIHAGGATFTATRALTVVH